MYIIFSSGVNQRLADATVSRLISTYKFVYRIRSKQDTDPPDEIQGRINLPDVLRGA